MMIDHGLAVNQAHMDDDDWRTCMIMLFLFFAMYTRADDPHAERFRAVQSGEPTPGKGTTLTAARSAGWPSAEPNHEFR